MSVFPEEDSLYGNRINKLLIPIYDLQKKAKKFKWMDKPKKL